MTLSLGWRIQLWHSVLLTFIVSGLLFSYHQLQERIALQEVDRSLKDPIVSLLPSISFSRRPSALPPRRLPRKAVELQKGIVSSGLYFASWGRRGRRPEFSSNAPSPHPGYPGEAEPGYSSRTRGDYREVWLSGKRVTVLVGVDISPLHAASRLLAWQLVGLGLAIISAGIGVGLLLTRRSLRPVREIAHTATEIAAGDLSRRVPETPHDDEIGQLTRVLNHTFTQLEENFERQARFTADASHELRTPVAVILAKSQFALSRERPAEKYRAALQSCQNAAEHMQDLLNSLLDLSRIDAGRADFDLQHGDLSQTASESTQMLQPLAGEKAVSLSVKASAAPACFDSSAMKQVALNLIGNALKYHPGSGWVQVVSFSNDSHSILEVIDNGPGVPEDLEDLIFDRFTRADSARTLSTSTGLGLPLARAIVEAHGGTLTLEKAAGPGAHFRVTLPRVVQENSKGSETQLLDIPGPPAPPAEEPGHRRRS